MWTSCLFLALFVTVQGRAVNISNTWVLPEEGFPVFYRYFKDRISWYEADAVCQFHHANLVTVDTTAQYDAVRAYLKELDISSSVWVGLIRSNPDGDFTWTDYRELSGEGYWSSAPDSRTAPLCAAADPAGDYRWEARACGGPSVASFICELPVPQWALGNDGCMVKSLPALTVLYLPETAAVQLTTDCGLAGVRRIQCTGSAKREDLLKNLSCFVEDSSSTTPNPHDLGDSLAVTTDSTLFDIENNEMTTVENTTSRGDGEQASNMKKTTMQSFILNNPNQLTEKHYERSSMPDLNLIENNNLYNNIPNIPSVVFKDDSPNTEYENKLEDDRHFQHKLLHDELARLGNFETLFNQESDHFIPPLVMAKAKLSNDMTAISFEEKLAQEHDNYQFMKQSNDMMKTINTDSENTTLDQKQLTDKENTKKLTPKKYNYKTTKYIDAKRKSIPILNLKKSVADISLLSTTLLTTTSTEIPTVGHTDFAKKADSRDKDDTSIELTVIIREPTDVLDDSHNNTSNMSVQTIETAYDILNVTSELHDEAEERVNVVTVPNLIILNDDIINITLGSSFFEGTGNESKALDNLDTTINVLQNISKQSDNPEFFQNTLNVHINSTPTDIIIQTGNNIPTDSTENNFNNTNTSTDSYLGNHELQEGPLLADMVLINITQDITPNIVIDNITQFTTSFENVESNIEQHSSNNSSDEDMDDFQSPLFSGADEPIHKPLRSRRPQTAQNRAKKFNPFRILG
ncbi:unnamed protein product [Leptosia nina]|uniref:C-type lectin domain-containing protein n=1 Tax=Leptosia nina TaxID=320188 RepID=A0AAV1JPW7_9NEOP